ncbi:serine/threonine protein kinase [Streptomyces rimosus subsp. rimosus]|nr:serine/threonine protein kinase [Streptomyces sp. NRRL WC-3701]KOT28146.1 serine/threonine protein kinase [Streptomyces rimosus subsp. rimosus]KOT47750.1 serine/threonine protein kinase [Streptomyces rimosus subsp. rimosus]KOT49095.1 serine/threonine protein kinase [Streptomyces rimosus subsp. rimosus]KOT82826.1 serine/threonine protein kinase [Streptomyces rimosus subsp. rimosus]
MVAGRYRLVEEIGRGGMGTVWRSYDELLGRQVAVKRLHVSPQLEPDELARRNERTRREAQSAARINHPNVVSVHDVVDDAGLPCIVMEYVPSVTLGDLIKEATLSDGAVPLGEVARIGRGMVAALRAAHSAGVLHRDVKPGNVLLGEDGRVVLTDFGIAVATGTSTLTKTGELIGSIDYLAPERVRGGTPGPASDLWALGATLYQALEGRPPFRKLTAVETAYSIAVDPLDPPRNAGALTGLIEALLAKDPADRPSAQAVEQALRAPAAHTNTTAWLSGASAHGAAGDSTATTAGTTPPAHGDHTNTPAPTPAPTPPSATGSYHLAPPATNGTSDTSTAGNTAGNTAPTGAFTPATGPTAPVNHPATAPATTPPPSEKQPGKRGRTILLTAVSLVAALALAGSTLYALGYWPDGDAQASDSRTPQPENPSPTPSKPRAKPTPRPVPAGYHRVTDPAAGVDFPLPNGWTRQKQANGSVYLNPNQLVGLRIESLDFAGANPLQRWKDNERAALNEGKFPGYQQLRMQETRFRDRPAALWEWKWSGSRREFRAIDLGFGRPGEKEYAIYLSAPATEWDRYKKVFDDVLAGLRLPEDREQAGQDDQAKRDDQ